MPYTHSKTFRKSLSSPSKTSKSKTRKSRRETQVTKFGKMRGKSVLNTMRQLRIDAYIQYSRNAKFLLRFGSIPHLRMYRTLRNEHEMFADFSAKYPKLNELYQLFVQYNIVKQRDTEIMESRIREETERIRKQYEFEAELKVREMESRMKQMTEQYVSTVSGLTQQKKQLEKVLENVYIEKEQFKSEYRAYMRHQHEDNSAETARLHKTIDELLAHIQYRDVKIAELEEYGVGQDKRVGRQAEYIDELAKTIDELNAKITELYCTNIVSQGIDFVRDYIKNTWSYISEMGTKADAELKAERRERQTRRKLAEEMEKMKVATDKIREEAEKIRREMEEEKERIEKERLEREQKEREEQEQREREQKEREEQEQKEREEQERMERERQEKEQKEREQKEKEKTHSSPVGKLKVQRDKIIEKMKELNKLRIAEDKNCNALKDDLDIQIPPCKSKESLNRVRKLFVKNHPDKNPNCLEYATKKTQLLSDLKDYINDLNNC